MGKKLFIFSIISTLLVSGCGKKTPMEAARPIPLGGSAVTAVDPTTPALTETESAYGTEPALGETAPIEEDSPFGETTDTPAPTETETAVEDAPASSAEELAAKATADAAAKAAADAAAKKKAEDEAKAKAEREEKEAEEEAKEKAEREAEEAAELAAMTPKFVKSIGNGSLKSSFGVAAASGFLYVVDNARTGLLGSFAAVRQYDVASGDFTKSFENIGWSGAKNMPTTVTRVKFVDGNIVAADSVNSYFYGTDGALIKTEAATFPLTTSVLDPNTDDTFKLNGGKIDRIHNGKVVLSFGADIIDDGNGIAVDEDGNLFVSEKAKGLVHHFAPAED